ncbi:MAG: nuclear transport factor 2 family protein, partial [Solirubrobacterales bacterium]
SGGGSSPVNDGGPAARRLRRIHVLLTRRRGSGMSQINSEILRLAYEAVSRHGPEAGGGFADEGVEIVDGTGVTERRSSGLEALAEVYGRAGRYFDDLTIEPTELIDAGDAVVACLRVGGTALANGAESWSRAFHVHWLRDGRTVRLAVCPDRTSALRTAASSRAAPATPTS